MLSKIQFYSINSLLWIWSVTIIGINIIDICDHSLTPTPQSLGWKTLIFSSSKRRRPLTQFCSSVPCSGTQRSLDPIFSERGTTSLWASCLQNRCVQSANELGAEPRRCQLETNQTPAERLIAPALWWRPGCDWDARRHRGEKYPPVYPPAGWQASTGLQDTQTLAVCCCCCSGLFTAQPPHTHTHPTQPAVTIFSLSEEENRWLQLFQLSFCLLHRLMSQESLRLDKIQTLTFHFTCLLHFHC